MKQYNFVDKEFYDLTSEDIKSMRRGEYLSRIPMSDFLTHYNITAWEYCNRLRELKGLSLVKDERKAWIDEKKEKEKLMPQADHTFRVENLPDIFVAAMYEVDFEVVKGRRLYDVEELEKAREDIGNKVERYLHLIQETSNNMAYSKLRGIDLIAMRIYRGLNRQAFSKISRLKLSDIKHFESLQQKIPKYIETTYREKLNIRKRHIMCVR
uniref:hypothetical protein n=1 Tax=Ornithinibacillus scapharcae TaxID=1147159 RepID=UPI000225B2EF